jgi:hypothetical protein
MILVMVTLLLGAVIPAAAAGVAPFIMAQQEEDASLGEQEEEGLADMIVSDVLDDESVVVLDQDNTAEQDAAGIGLQDQDSAQEQEAAQDAANTDFDVQEGVQQQLPSPSPPPTEPPGEEPPNEEPPGPPPEEPGATVITITGTTSDEKVLIQENLHESFLITVSFNL